MNEIVPVHISRKPIYVVLLAETSDGQIAFFMRQALVVPILHLAVVQPSNDVSQCQKAEQMPGIQISCSFHKLYPVCQLLCYV
jgi:hypothetical protein